MKSLDSFIIFISWFGNFIFLGYRFLGNDFFVSLIAIIIKLVLEENFKVFEQLNNDNIQILRFYDTKQGDSKLASIILKGHSNYDIWRVRKKH